VARGPEESNDREPLLPAIGAGDSFRVALPSFEGPLDLLLHLTREHQIDLRDIPVAFITERYLEYLDLMKSLNLDVASEFLLMAATLIHLKSRLLLPPSEDSTGEGQDDELAGDPREELVRRLLEYQKYRDAAEQLAHRALLGRDVFVRPPSSADGSSEPELADVSVFQLLTAFDRVLKAQGVDLVQEIEPDRISLSEAISEIATWLGPNRRKAFADLFGVKAGQSIGRHRLVVTFLAVLEMARLRLIRVVQEDERSSLFLIGTEELSGRIRLVTGEGSYAD
jgi:segregation and condensation protein A